MNQELKYFLSLLRVERSEIPPEVFCPKTLALCRRSPYIKQIKSGVEKSICFSPFLDEHLKESELVMSFNIYRGS